MNRLINCLKVLNIITAILNFEIEDTLGHVVTEYDNFYPTDVVVNMEMCSFILLKTQILAFTLYTL